MDPTQLILFAQRGGPPDGGVGAIFALCCQGLIGVASIAWGIFVYVSIYQAFSAVSPRNRDMEPGMIFLMLIPCFGFIWYFFVVIRLASSLQKEFRDRGLPADGDFGQLLGILVIIPCAGVICSIMWVMKIRGYTAQLAQAGGGRASGRDSGFDDGFAEGLRRD